MGACVDPAEIQKLAKLSRLKITDETLEETAKSITNVLSLVDQLQAVDTTDVDPMAHPLDATQRLRADTVTEENQREKFQQCAPSVEEGLYLVPKVID